MLGHGRATLLDAGNSRGLWYQAVDGNTSKQSLLWGRRVTTRRIETIRSRLGSLNVIAGRFNARQGVGARPVGRVSKVRATPTREGASIYRPALGREVAGPSATEQAVGITELACGSQAFIATLLFDPSMSALPIIPKQNSVSVGLFTH